MADLIAWKCQDGHMMGQVRRKGHGESQLYLFREAIDLQDEHPAEQDVVAVMEGYVSVTVACSICGQNRVWVPGEEALARLIAAHQRMIKNQNTLEEMK